MTQTPPHDEVLARILVSIESEADFDPESELVRHPECADALRRSLSELRAAGMLPVPPEKPDFLHDLAHLGIDDVVGLRPRTESASSSSTDELVVPRVIGGRYRLRSVLGRGGMGIVYSADDLELQREVALKLLHFRTVSEPEGRRRVMRLLREARVTGQLVHPGIVPVYGLGLTSDRRLYYTMKLVRGRSLRELVRAYEQREPEIEREFTIQRRIEIVLRMCEALAFAHERGVVHRDLTPNNVMVGRFGEVLVMDWGIAKLLDQPNRPTEEDVQSDARSPSSPEGTTPGLFLGTPNFASPEQAGGDLHVIDERTDVFGVGATLYYLLTGQAPYMGKDRNEVEERARVAEPSIAPPSVAFPRLPRELVGVCRKAMAKEPTHRYASIGGLAADLRAYSIGQRGLAWNETVWSWTKKLVRRRPAAATATIALIGLVFIAVLAVKKVREVRVRSRALELNEQERSFEDALDRIRGTEGPTVLAMSVMSGPAAIELSPWPVPAAEESKAEYLYIFAASAEKLLGLLCDHGLSMDTGTFPPAAAVTFGFPDRPHSQELLIETVLEFARQCGLSGIAYASYADCPSGNAGTKSKDRQAIAQDHPRLVVAWRMLPRILESLGHYPVSIAALGAYGDWIACHHDSLGDQQALMAQARPEEADFLSFVIQQVRGNEGARSALEGAVRARPKNFWPHMRLAEFALMQGDSVLALKHSSAAAALNPKSQSALIARATAERMNGELHGSLETSNEALSLGPDDLLARMNLGCLYVARQECDRAIETLEPLRSEITDQFSFFLNLGLAYDQRTQKTNSDEDASRAIAAFKRVTELQPSWWQGYFRLGQSTMWMADFRSAIVQFDRGLTFYPKSIDLRVHKAECLWMLQDRASAAELLREVRKDHPDATSVCDLWRSLREEVADPEERRAIGLELEDACAK